MKKMSVIAVMACCLLAPVALHAQGTKNDVTHDLRGRLSIGFDKKISKGFHAFMEGEGRMKDNMGTFGRYDLTAGMSYKFNPYFKMAAGYTFINKKNSAAEWTMRHRVYTDFTGIYDLGGWRFSLRERLQFTHKAYDFNPYQSPRNELALKSRVKVQYRGFIKLMPYAYYEMRNSFNDATAKATWLTLYSSYDDYEFTGYNDARINRYRGVLGLEWRMSQFHSLDFYGMMDYCRDKHLDVNKEGTKLKSLTYDRDYRWTLGIGYKFLF